VVGVYPMRIARFVMDHGQAFNGNGHAPSNSQVPISAQADAVHPPVLASE